MPKTRDEIKKKPGFVPYMKDNDWQKDIIGIRVPDMDDSEPSVVNVGINGVHYNIPRGVNIRVPRLVADNLRTRYQPQWAMPAKKPWQGLQYMGTHSRFYVIELSEAEAKKAPEIKPAKPLNANERVKVEKDLIQARQDEIAARREIETAGVHEDLHE